MNAKIKIVEKLLHTSEDGQYMEIRGIVSILGSEPAKIAWAVSLQAYDYLDIGKEYELTSALTGGTSGPLTDSPKPATEVPPAPTVPECGAFGRCTLPLGHDGPHTDKATARAFEQALGAREGTPESECAQDLEAGV